MNVFVSYSHRDARLKESFRRHLKVLEDKFHLTVFDDVSIDPGEIWEQRIWDEFASSDIVFLLISSNFLASRFCMKQEFREAVRRHRLQEITMIPVILSSCEWRANEVLGSIKVLPIDGGPVVGGPFRSSEQGFSNVMSSMNKFLSSPIKTKRGRRNRRPARPSLNDYDKASYKAVFFDLDGTLIRGKVGHEYFRYSWELVWAHLGHKDAERKHYYQEYLDHHINYDQWCDITKELFREGGLREIDFRQMAKKVRLTKNCRETLKILRTRGIKTALVSGGIDSFLRAVFPDYGEYFDYTYINKFRYDEAGILSSIETTKYDFEGKFDAIKHTCYIEGISLDQCVFVGEGRNDIYAARQLSHEGGMTIGYPSDLLRDFVECDLWKDRLDAILDIVFSKMPFTKKPPVSYSADTDSAVFIPKAKVNRM